MGSKPVIRRDPTQTKPKVTLAKALNMGLRKAM